MQFFADHPAKRGFNLLASHRLVERLINERLVAALPGFVRLHRQSKVFLDVFRQSVVDLVVAWHWLLLSCSRIVVNVMAPTVPQKNTALLLDLADQLATLHSAISFVR